uniref:DUF6570 domain-containing protein n=1 Tax=Rhizochromulina marina TaxID=1034831 RepID=A0A7S2W2I2_9STRA|mmetsp:Transcript_12230/g.35385  ORF Transcript_12230/g.35385 Transcript_12230/m.35385 type:complete len:206 (+) Transcript_12230:765-1382(+)
MVLKSHVTFVDRSRSVTQVHDVLPLLPGDVLFVVLCRQRGGVQGGARRGVSLLCRREVVQAALEWLTTNSPAYSDVSIDAARIAELPENGPLDVRVVDDEDGVAAATVEEDLEPAPARMADPPRAVPRAGQQVEELAETTSGTVSGGGFGTTAASVAGKTPLLTITMAMDLDSRDSRPTHRCRGRRLLTRRAVRLWGSRPTHRSL